MTAAGDETAFRELADAFRGELQAHCYRIMGSVQDAEDLVQETLLAAWRGLEGFEGRASLRSWLYRIATNRCLNALRDRGRRVPELPPPPAEAPQPPEPTRRGEPVWLEPYPDALLEGVIDRSREPHARYEAREAIGLAFVAGLQRLPPRQRAVLVLRDVLGFRAAEVADTLGTTEASVTSALHRARSALDAGMPVADPDEVPLPDSRHEREVVARFTDAFEGGDVEGVVALLTDDAWLTMPPTPLEYQGPAAIARFLSSVPAGGRLERFRLVPTRANGQPAFGCYLRDPHTPIAHAYGLMVLTLRGSRVAAITGFPDTSLFAHFGLPRTLRAAEDRLTAPPGHRARPARPARPGSRPSA
jgi:RNA polymerase sigma-70 factor (TIGR02960 family)